LWSTLDRYQVSINIKQKKLIVLIGFVIKFYLYPWMILLPLLSQPLSFSMKNNHWQYSGYPICKNIEK